MTTRHRQHDDDHRQQWHSHNNIEYDDADADADEFQIALQQQALYYERTTAASTSLYRRQYDLQVEEWRCQRQQGESHQQQQQFQHHEEQQQLEQEPWLAHQPSPPLPQFQQHEQQLQREQFLQLEQEHLLLRQLAPSIHLGQQQYQREPSTVRGREEQPLQHPSFMSEQGQQQIWQPRTGQLVQDHFVLEYYQEEELQSPPREILWEEQFCNQLPQPGAKHDDLMARAWSFAERMMDVFWKLSHMQYKIAPIMSLDELVTYTERFLHTQETFRNTSRPYQVDIGYHYTSIENLDLLVRRKEMNHGDNDGWLMSRTTSEATFGSYNLNSCHPYQQSTFGDGVYTGSNPYDFHTCGRNLIVGLFVARLHGFNEQVNVLADFPSFSGRGPNHDSITVQNHETCRETVVLRKSCQVLPLFQFDVDLMDMTLDQTTGNDLLYCYHCELQNLLDIYFNDGRTTVVKRPIPPPPAMPPYESVAMNTTLTSPFAASAAATAETDCNDNNNDAVVVSFETAERTIVRTSPQRPLTASFMPTVAQLLQPLRPKTIEFRAPPIFTTLDTCAVSYKFHPHEIPRNQNCPICLEPLLQHHGGSSSSSLNNDHVVVAQANACQHLFHASCLQSSLRYTPDCPLCRKSLLCDRTLRRGKMPSGKMTCLLAPRIVCDGTEDPDYEDVTLGSIVIDYCIDSGRQRCYHDRPNELYAAQNQRAYLPNSIQGRQLLKRLQIAFQYGLTFQITNGINETSEQHGYNNGNSNSGAHHGNAENRMNAVVTWSSIRHKTSPTGGTSYNGFPDLDYIKQCNHDLDELGVPSFFNDESGTIMNEIESTAADATTTATTTSTSTVTVNA